MARVIGAHGSRAQGGNLLGNVAEPDTEDPTLISVLDTATGFLHWL